MRRPKAELAPDGKHINVFFDYHKALVESIKDVPGASFVGHDRLPDYADRPFWRVSASWSAAQLLRRAMGPDLKLGPRLNKWGREKARDERRLMRILRQEVHELPGLRAELPELWKLVQDRPYQTNDIAMMAATDLLNANAAGTGKTIEAMGAIAEAGILEGQHLIITPATSIEPTWGEELRKHGQPIVVLAEGDPSPRSRAIKQAARLAEEGEPFFLVVNFEQVRRRYRINEEGQRTITNEIVAQEIAEIEWTSCIIDEVHKSGLATTNSAFTMGMRKIVRDRIWLMSGTPSGGKPVKLWSYFHTINPDEYTTKWGWAKSWLETEEKGFGHEYGKLLPGQEAAFYEQHATVLIRREKREALPGIPRVQRISVSCGMSPAQKKQYEAMQENAEIRIEEEQLSAMGVLAEYARLKQFANARHQISKAKRKREKIDVEPTKDSGKIKRLIAKLDEHGIRREDPQPGEQAIIASESRKFILLVREVLEAEGISTGLIVGGMKKSDVSQEIRRFKAGRQQCICMTTTAGGVSLNLQEANSVHLLDETWNPDDQSQLIDRADRGSRTTPLVAYTYRTKGTIQQYIQEVCKGKELTDKNVLDVHRRIFLGR